MAEISEILDDNDEVLFSVRSHFSEKEYRCIVYKTREWERHKRALIMLVASALCVVVGLCADKLRMVAFAVFLGVCIAYNYIQPLIFTNKHIKKMRETYGTAEHITDCYFVGDRVKVIFEGCGIAISPEYKQITRLYVKKDWLFFCAENLRGFYVKKSAVEDVGRLIEFIREKNFRIKLYK